MANLSKCIAVIPVLVFAFAGCDSGGDDDSGNKADPLTEAGTGGCKPTTGGNVAGEPDIVGAVTVAPSAAAKGGTVTFSIPIDADTRSINAVVRTQINGTVAGASNYTVATVAAQTVSVPVRIGASAPAGTYRAFFNLCSGYNIAADCAPGGTGTMITYGELAATSTTLARWTSIKSGQIVSNGVTTETCLPIPQITVQ
jgi:hypothetical protein